MHAGKECEARVKSSGPTPRDESDKTNISNQQVVCDSLTFGSRFVFLYNEIITHCCLGQYLTEFLIVQSFVGGNRRSYFLLARDC